MWRSGNTSRSTATFDLALEGAGYTQTLVSDYRPPVARYVLGDATAGFYAEFLTPLTGSGFKRTGEPDATLAKAGVTAQKLRHLDLLLQAPWVVTIPSEDSGIGETVEGLRIPNPVSFVMQKILIRERRAKEKRSQDVLYIHDTLELFAARIDELVPIWSELAAALSGKERAEVLDGAKEMFGEVNDTLREAARIQNERTLNPDDMQALCSTMFEVLFA